MKTRLVDFDRQQFIYYQPCYEGEAGRAPTFGTHMTCAARDESSSGQGKAWTPARCLRTCDAHMFADAAVGLAGTPYVSGVWLVGWVNEQFHSDRKLILCTWFNSSSLMKEY